MSILSFPFKKLRIRTPLRQKIWRLALPVSFSMLTYTGIMISDTVMLSPLGSVALAAGGLGGMVLWTVLSFFLGASFGIQIIAARRYGEKNYQALANVFVVSLILGSATGAITTIAVYYLAPWVIFFLANGGDFSQSTISFVQIRSLGLFPYFIIFIIRSFFDGIGKTQLGLFFSVTIMLSNIMLNWLLIYGNWGYPALGIDGAAIASSCASVIGLIVAVICVLSKKQYLSFLRCTPTNIPHLAYEIIRISLPSALDNCFMNLAFTFFYKIAAMIGTVAVASTNILISIISISFMPGFGFSIAAATLLGQAIAQKKFQKAYVSAWRTANYSAKIMGIIGIGFLLFGKTMLSLLANGNNQIIEDAYPALLLISFLQIADAYQMVLGAVLRSAGLVLWVFGVYTVSSYFILLPGAYLLGVVGKGGTLGLWGGISLWILSQWFFFSRKFRSGSWKGVKV